MSSHFVLGGLRVATHLAAAPSKTLRVQRDPAGQAGHALARPSWRSSSTYWFLLFQVVMLIFHRPRVLSTGTSYTKTRCASKNNQNIKIWGSPWLFNIITLILEFIFNLLSVNTFSRDITAWSPAPLLPSTWSLRWPLPLLSTSSQPNFVSYVGGLRTPDRTLKHLLYSNDRAQSLNGLRWVIWSCKKMFFVGKLFVKANNSWIIKFLHATAFHDAPRFHAGADLKYIFKIPLPNLSLDV